jgi:hypothetical protein
MRIGLNLPCREAGGGGTFDGMEARVARLESDVAHIQADIGEIEDTLKNLNVICPRRG